MRKVTIVAYDERWPDLFDAESARLQMTLGKAISRIHHIGSTSVPGLAAKPVIDILLEVVGLNELDQFNTAMERIGYTVRGENGIPNRRYFTKGGEKRSHQVHAFVTGDRQIQKHLAFRDYLIKNKKAAERYVEIKYAAALASENDIHRYSAFKADFIEHHLRLALMSREG
ncbi:GrpB family protein [Dickeya undicola]|uniref:GrpB family protein n=1 Tax=Dickeya undicola TaxID=1577887 RepID=A0A3N0FSI4_9GAMM|nr:GrpB family protein [Dickeya undicola]RNM03114.1 GrpB family protein [Dickeya undicola]RNM21687.1 GrpB family protein [Dickeya undicola]